MGFKEILITLGNFSRPKKYCLYFILIHWMLLFPISLAIGGHPPIPLMLLYLPTMLAIYLIAIVVAAINIQPPVRGLEHLFLFILIPVNTLTYGIIGYIVGLAVQKKNNKKLNTNN